jgi:arylsulfatase A-like enzyme
VTAEESAQPGHAVGDLVRVALVFGLAGGLFEAVVRLTLQHLNFVADAWYQTLWIAPIVNSLLLTAFALGLAVLLRLARWRSWVCRAAIFALIFAAAFPGMVTLLKPWIQPYAIALLTAGIASVLARRFMRKRGGAIRVSRLAVAAALAVAGFAFVAERGGSWLRDRLWLSKLPSASASAPDVLIIIVDTLRADHMSGYGYARRTTPALDRLAGEGVAFEQAYSTSSYTLPSHASILTGLNPSQHGVEWQTSRTQETASYPTLAETLRTRGYRTGAFSANTFWFTRAHGFGRGFLHFDDFYSSLADTVFRTASGRIFVELARRSRTGFADIPARKRAPETNRAILDWLGQDPSRPSLVVVNYMDVHDPYLPPRPYRTKFSKQDNPGGILNWETHVPDSLSAEELQGEVDAYDGAISYVDDQIQQLLASFSAGRSRDLVVVITSDHGEEFGEHGHYLHGQHLYREVIHVPLIVWSPRRVPSGIRVAQPVSNTAVPATVMNVLEPGDRTFPGPPLQALWEARATPSDHPMPLAELQRRHWEPDRNPVKHGSMRSLVSPSWHYIEHETRGIQLYRWVDDPRESSDLAKAPGSQAVIDEFQRRLKH